MPDMSKVGLSCATAFLVSTSASLLGIIIGVKKKKMTQQRIKKRKKKKKKVKYRPRRRVDLKSSQVRRQPFAARPQAQDHPSSIRVRRRVSAPMDESRVFRSSTVDARVAVLSFKVGCFIMWLGRDALLRIIAGESQGKLLGWAILRLKTRLKHQAKQSRARRASA